MNNKNLQIGNIFMTTLKVVIRSTLKVTMITLAWGLKFSGLFLSRLGETIERIIIKTHS
jgi:hypothetical protein